MFIIKRSFIKKSLAAAIAGGMGLTLLPSASEAGKEITPSCDASYLVKYKKINGVVPQSGGTAFGNFSATRHCGRTVPNRCRERAREAIFTCGKIHYDQRWTRNTIPTHCTTFEGVKNYNVRDMKDELEKAVCCGANNKLHKNMEVELSVQSRGDDGCGSGRKFGFSPEAWSESRRLEDSYLIDCVDARKRLCK